jgi:hypothetical protein
MMGSAIASFLRFARVLLDVAFGDLNHGAATRCLHTNHDVITKVSDELAADHHAAGGAGVSAKCRTSLLCPPAVAVVPHDAHRRTSCCRPLDELLLHQLRELRLVGRVHRVAKAEDGLDAYAERLEPGSRLGDQDFDALLRGLGAVVLDHVQQHRLRDGAAALEQDAEDPR